jgi:UDP-N-acetylmuramyl pentapeptide phosphotransferase/UDP-N-acetylglucosamine-1-phosphate transferase
VPPFAQLLVGTLLAAAVAGALLTQLAIVYSRRARLVDEPGQRRSHAAPTARGGGIAIVLVLLAAVPWAIAQAQLPSRAGVAFALGLALVAAIGWLDDHRPLRVSTRLVVHFAAAAIWAWHLPRGGDALVPGLIVGAVQVVALVAAINFWNFMDGINGLIATQSIAAALCALLLFLIGLEPGWSLVCAALIGAGLGFLPFNFPRARIFLGDVGSGGLGFACGALLLQAQASDAVDLPGALLVASVIGIDAGLTLLGRMARGRRWYNAHREHLYQWLVRRGRSHADVTSLYLLWSLLVVLPVLVLMRSMPAWSPALGAAALAAGALAWWLARRSVLRGARA